MKTIITFVFLLTSFFAIGQSHHRFSFASGGSVDSLDSAATPAGVILANNTPLLSSKDSSLYTTTTALDSAISGVYDSLQSDSTVILPTITTLESYTGNANIIFVSDTLRGGWFNKTTIGMPDSGICFPDLGGGFWKRVYSGDILATWYGAVGDSMTDNTAAIRLWLSSPYVKGNYARLPKGNYLVSDTILIANQCRINGSAGYAPYQGTAGVSPSGIYAGGSSVIIETVDKNLFHITANGIYMDGLTLKNKASSVTSSVGILVDSGYAFKLHNTFLQGFYDELNISGGTEITIAENQFVNPIHRFINFGGYIGDEGDNLVQGNWFENITSVDTGVYVTGTAGFRFFDNKMHIPVGQTTGNYMSVDLFLKAITTTSDVSIQRNSIEAYQNAGVYVTTDNTHSLGKVQIISNNTTNNTGGNMRNIVVYTPVANAINGLIISNNAIGNQGTLASIYLQNINNYIVSNNTFGVPINPVLEDTEINCSNRRSDRLSGDVSGFEFSNLIQSITPLNGASPTQQMFPNILAYQFASSVTGATIIHTKIPRTANHMFQIHVHGTSFSAITIDFTVSGYLLSSQNGSIDGQPGSVYKQSIIDNGTDGLNKYVGIDSLGYLSIAIGDTNTSQNNLSFNVDYTNLIGGSASTYIPGWFVTKSTVTNFHWGDNRTITSNPPIRGTITLTGAVTGVGANSIATTLANNAVTYAKVQTVGANKLLGNPTGATANLSEISLGAGLSLSGNTLTATGSGGTVTSITPAWGFTNNTPITTSGSMVIDTTKVCSIYALADTSVIWHTALIDSASALRAMTTTLTGDVTGSGNGSFATTISSHAVTYAKIQTVSANKLLGNPNGSTANVSEIGLGSNMTIFSGNLTKYIPSTNVTSDYTATNSDELILAEPTGSNITITLPNTGIVAGKSFIVKGINASPTQTVTVTAPTSIDGNVSDTVLTTDNQAIWYVFDGTKYWIVSSYNPLPPVYGSSTQSGDGTTTAFTIAHGLGATPTWYNVVPTSSAAANIAYITADATNITVHYTVAPALGTNNLTYNFQAKQ